MRAFSAVFVFLTLGGCSSAPAGPATACVLSGEHKADFGLSSNTCAAAVETLDIVWASDGAVIVNGETNCRAVYWPPTGPDCVVEVSCPGARVSACSFFALVPPPKHPAPYAQIGPCGYSEQ